MVFCGYTLILVIDKVMFDTHALFDHDDEAEGTAEQRLNDNLKRSFANDGTSKVQAQEDLQTGIKEYLSTQDRFSARLKASFKGDDQQQAIADQQQYFVTPVDATVNKSEILTDNVRDEEKVQFSENLIADVGEPPKAPCCNMTPYILMLALSIHAIFEGIALGLQAGFFMTLDIVVAIAIHKGAASSALGISLVKTFPDDFGLVKKLILIFACATPLGVTIGILASNAGDLVNVIMSSLAAGTFIYIACTEIIVAEFSVGGHRWLKCSAFILGACIISSLSFVEKD